MYCMARLHQLLHFFILDRQVRYDTVDHYRERQRCCCDTQLARDNLGEQCAACQRADKGGRPLSPPEVPDEFWEHPTMRDALVRRHMGHVIRAFRKHPLHGQKAILQGTVAGWIGITQAQVSRIENGPPIVDLKRLIDWALLLHIPEEYLWFSLPERNGGVERSCFPQFDDLAVAGITTSGLFRTRPAASLTDRDCAQWLAWELWQRGEQALHLTELPLSIARYLNLVDANGQLARCVNIVSPDGNIFCDQDGYCSLAHPSFIDFYVAQRLFVDIAVGESKLLATTQTTHTTDLILQKFILRHQPSADFLNKWMTKGANAVLRVNSAGILAKLGAPTVTDVVVTNLKTDPDSRQLYLTAVSSRVLNLKWNQAAQFAVRVERTASDVRCDLTTAQLAVLARELSNPRDGAARWCSAVLLGHCHDSGPEVVRAALHRALQAEPCRENLRVIGTVLAGKNPLKT
jgi:transcriptional regulator with XRE-family HTH domain